MNEILKWASSRGIFKILGLKMGLEIFKIQRFSDLFSKIEAENGAGNEFENPWVRPRGSLSFLVILALLAYAHFLILKFW